MTIRQFLKNLLWPQDFDWYPCPYDSNPMIQYGFYLHSLWCSVCKREFIVHRFGGPPLRDVNGPLKGAAY